MDEASEQEIGGDAPDLIPPVFRVPLMNPMSARPVLRGHTLPHLVLPRLPLPPSPSDRPMQRIPALPHLVLPVIGSQPPTLVLPELPTGPRPRPQPLPPSPLTHSEQALRIQRRENYRRPGLRSTVEALFQFFGACLIVGMTLNLLQLSKTSNMPYSTLRYWHKRYLGNNEWRPWKAEHSYSSKKYNTTELDAVAALIIHTRV